MVPDVALHIYQRGNNRQVCFRRPGDYLVYLAILREQFEKRACALHAYCLMTNHVHLLVTPQDATVCARLMRDLAGCYAGYFNRRYGRTGTLWEGRFGSCLVDSARYVLGCYRYVELNPVRAGMVSGPLVYEWSSARANAGLAKGDGLVAHAEYVALGENDGARRHAYRTLLDSGDDAGVVENVRKATGGGYALVGDTLKAQLIADGARVQPGKRGPKPKLAP